MSRPYGKFVKPYRKAGRASRAACPENLRVRINGRNDLEEATHLFLQLIAQLQDAGVANVENLAVYLAPLNARGERMILKNAKGETRQTIEIATPVSARFRCASRG